MTIIYFSDKDAIKSRRELFELPGYTGVCLTYCVTCTVQYSVLQWGPVYLVNDLGHTILTGLYSTLLFLFIRTLKMMIAPKLRKVNRDVKN